MRVLGGRIYHLHTEKSRSEHSQPCHKGQYVQGVIILYGPAPPLLQGAKKVGREKSAAKPLSRES